MITRLLGKQCCNLIKIFGISNLQQEIMFSDNENGIHDYSQGYCMMIQEFCQNGDLLNFTLKKSLHYEQSNYFVLVRKIFSQIFRGISKIHHEADICLLNL
jgi:hypothetical protein